LRTSLGRSLRLTGTIATSLTLCIGILAGSASASSKSAGGHAIHNYCAIVLAPLQPGQSVSHVISRTCVKGKIKPDFSRFLSASGVNPAITPFIEFFQNYNYGGNLEAFYPYEPCSASNSGYAFDDTRPADNGLGSWGISSWRAHDSCWHTTIYYNYSYGSPSYTYAQGVWESAKIGSPYNDHVWSVYTRYQ